MSYVFQLLREDEGLPPAVVFEDTTSPGLVPLWEEVGVYDALYNSDGRRARDISRAIAFGLDRVSQEEGLARLLPAGLSLSEAARFLDNVHRACTTHAAAEVRTR
ncbi:hypothetical protein B0920_13875 [Massilia sp. KIM]|jgi:hypothetical protein|uniref:hypothetical protein n=1 Tax=Massilia sp. KIM TaxID=1955422 RepID=UPI00098F4D43|nr:hypothetical protein [Massilia sp. KIM]OON64367.1 hypothetical protein B0920_13875 [Massilia sp. KIM]